MLDKFLKIKPASSASEFKSKVAGSLRLTVTGSLALILLISCSPVQSPNTVGSKFSLSEEGKKIGYEDYYLGMSLSRFYERKLPKAIDSSEIPTLKQETDPDTGKMLGCVFEGAFQPPFDPSPAFVFLKVSENGKSILACIGGDVPLSKVDSAVEFITKTFGKPTVEHPLNSLGKVEYAWKKNGCEVSLEGDAERAEKALLTYYLSERKEELLRASRQAMALREERLSEDSRKSRVTAAASEESDEERKQDLESMNDGLVPDYEEVSAEDWQVPSSSSKVHAEKSSEERLPKDKSPSPHRTEASTTSSSTQTLIPISSPTPRSIIGSSTVSTKMPMALPNPFAVPAASPSSHPTPVPAPFSIGKVGAPSAPSPAIAALPSSSSGGMPAPIAAISTRGTSGGGGSRSPVPVMAGGSLTINSTAASESGPSLAVAPSVPRPAAGSTPAPSRAGIISGEVEDFEFKVRFLPLKTSNGSLEFLVTEKNCTETKILNSYTPSISVCDEFGNSYAVSKSTYGSDTRRFRKMHPGEESEYLFKIDDRLLPKARTLTVKVSQYLYARNSKEFKIPIE